MASSQRRRVSKGRNGSPSIEKQALHEVVGWLLGALFASHEDTARLVQLPALLAENCGHELDLLRRVLLNYQDDHSQEFAVGRARLLNALHAYCENPAAALGLASAVSVDQFMSHVQDIIHERARRHRVVPLNLSLTPGNGRSVRRRLSGKRADQETSPGEKTNRAVSDDIGECETSDTCGVGPDSGDACEGCGRITDSCLAHGALEAILCSSCRNASAPVMWAFARECFQILASPAPI